MLILLGLTASILLSAGVGIFDCVLQVNVYIMTPTKMLTTVAILLIGFIATVSANNITETESRPPIPITSSTSTKLTTTSISPTTPAATGTIPTTASISPTTPAATGTIPTTASISPTTPAATGTIPTTASISPTTPAATGTIPTTASISPTTPAATVTKPTMTSISYTTPATSSISSTTSATSSIASTTPATTSISSTTSDTSSIASTTPATTSISSTTSGTSSISSTTSATTSISYTSSDTSSIASTTPATTSNPSNTPANTSISSTTPATSGNASTTPATTNISCTTLATTDISSTTPVTSSSGSTTTNLMPSTTIPAIPPSQVKISETNILFSSLEEDLFVELTGKPNEALQGWRLSVYNASSPLRHNDFSSSTSLNGTLDAEGRKVVAKITHTNLNWKAFSAFESVLIVLGYKDEMDFLIYSSKGEIDPGIAENYTTPYYLTFDMKYWENKNLSLSRCSPANDMAGFVLTRESRDAPNYCTFSQSQNLEMKLTLKDCKNIDLPPDYNLTSTNKIITEVNKRKQCGFSRFMVRDFYGRRECFDNKNQVYFKFRVIYDLPTQWDLIRDGYQSFILDKSSVFNLAGYDWMISNCTEHCSPAVKPPDAGDDDRIRVTVAVVVSCIGVFLIVLIFVIIYMKNKRRGILQFRMTRLDDDEDDLIGDMDDFVGNQGPTFRNFS